MIISKILNFLLLKFVGKFYEKILQNDING